MLAIRVDGNLHIGLGHLYRCIRLAKRLRTTEGVVSEFLLLESSLSSQIESTLKDEGFAWRLVSLPDDPWVEDLGKTDALLTAKGYDGILADLLMPDPDDDDLLKNREYSPADVQGWLRMAMKGSAPVILFSDQFEKMTLAADLIINSCPAQKIEWYNSSPERAYLVGNDSYPLGDEFQRFLSAPKEFPESGLRINCFFGGNDHIGFTDPVIEALMALDLPINVRLFVGAATPNGEEKAAQYRAMGSEAEFATPDIAARLFEADLVICTSGTTLQDLAAIGVPAIAFATRKRQEVTARFFEEVGYCRYLGRWGAPITEPLQRVVRELYDDRRKLYAMRAAGRKAVDGKGTERIAAAIATITRQIA